jgi:hypothetical protein
MINIIQGEDKTLALTINKTSGPYDLTSATEIILKFPTQSGTPLEKKLSNASLSITNAALGKISVPLSDTNTNTLRPEENQGIELYIDVGASRRIFQIKEILNVYRAMFP